MEVEAEANSGRTPWGPSRRTFLLSGGLRVKSRHNSWVPPCRRVTDVGSKQEAARRQRGWKGLGQRERRAAAARWGDGGSVARERRGGGEVAVGEGQRSPNLVRRGVRL